jgi:4-carboxymuconolactone decarboxylase
MMQPSRCSAGLCGYYTLVSMTLNAFEFGLPEGEVSELS